MTGRPANQAALQQNCDAFRSKDRNGKKTDVLVVNLGDYGNSRGVLARSIAYFPAGQRARHDYLGGVWDHKEVVHGRSLGRV